MKTNVILDKCNYSSKYLYVYDEDYNDIIRLKEGKDFILEGSRPISHISYTTYATDHCKFKMCIFDTTGQVYYSNGKHQYRVLLDKQADEHAVDLIEQEIAHNHAAFRRQFKHSMLLALKNHDNTSDDACED